MTHVSYVATERAPAQNVRMELFGRNLRKRARELSLTDAEVARRAGLTERRYGFYVSGDREPDLTTLVRISDVLQTSVDDLLGRGKKPTRQTSKEAALLSAATALTAEHMDLLVATAEAFARYERKTGVMVAPPAGQHSPSRKKTKT